MNTKATEYVAITDDVLRAMPIRQLIDLRTKVHAERIEIEGQLASRGDAARLIPYTPDFAPPERTWFLAAKKALAHRVAFGLRVRKVLSDRNAEVARNFNPSDPARRSQSAIICDLVRLLSGYDFDAPDESELRLVLAEAAAVVARKSRFAAQETEETR